ncbi:MAG: hypothetical protein LBT66_05970 [Methanobrevibacter sp.]|jgi:hypothetical protein|nr:hypothetical protein [Candidatus Methanovirga meridionalis]
MKRNADKNRIKNYEVVLGLNEMKNQTIIIKKNNSMKICDNVMKIKKY